MTTAADAAWRCAQRLNAMTEGSNPQERSRIPSKRTRDAPRERQLVGRVMGAAGGDPHNGGA